jgi:hypothetical protein
VNGHAAVHEDLGFGDIAHVVTAKDHRGIRSAPAGSMTVQVIYEPALN